MFYNCESLTSLNFSNFETTNVQFMDNMFYGCHNLTELDLSSFNTSNVSNFAHMFDGCLSLTSLDISNFDASSVTEIGKFDDIFTNCEKLEFINLKNYKDCDHDLTITNFQSTSTNLVICTLNTKLNQILENDPCIINNCEENWYIYKTKIFNNNECTNDCKSISYKYEFKNQCYRKCPEGTIKRENDNNLNKFNLNNKYFCKPECNKKEPFEMVFEQQCVENCDIKDILNKLCILNYYEEKSRDNNYDNIIESLEQTLVNGGFNT